MCIDRLTTIRKLIDKACQRCGRDPQEVIIIGASKYQSTDAIIALAKAGLQDFGENYEQELTKKRNTIIQSIPELAEDIRWHFIGTLQRRKVRKLIGQVASIHSLDSHELAIELDERAAAQQLMVRALVQINMGEEATKGGIHAEELAGFIKACRSLFHLKISGLMTLPPFHQDPEESRSYFRTMRELRDAINEQDVYKEPLMELSMGMSHDFEVAIEEGSTMVRIGTALFGERQRK